GDDVGMGVEAEVVRAAETEAAAVAAAIVAASSGVRPGGPDPDPAGNTSGPASSPASGPAVRPVRGTLEAEAAWLVRVADAFARSTAERPVRARVPAELQLSRGRERAPASAPGRKG
ncbi:DUF6545 domain-containing protein, partial [Streptomyces milbemycinicus]